MATIETLSADIASLRSEVKNLAKLVRKIRSHQEDPTGEKTKERTKNNGFNRKMEVTDKLRKFLELPEGETISRSDVTRRINKYIKEKDLKHPDNGRVIVMDGALTDLLSPPAGEQITFLNIQKFISPHYVKPAGGDPEPPKEEPKEEAKKPATKRPTVRKPKAT